MSSQVNLLPFVVEAVVQNKNTWRDIDKIYQANKYQFYSIAKKSEWYNHAILAEGDIYRQEYGRKMLGILLYSTEHQEIVPTIFDMLKKNFKDIYTFVEDSETVCIDDYIKERFTSLDDLNRLSDDKISAIYTMIAFFAMNLDKPLVPDTEELIMQIFTLRMEHYDLSHPQRINYKTLSKNVLNKCRSIQQRIYDNTCPIRCFRDFYYIRSADDEELKNWLDSLDLIFDYEGLSPSVLFDNINFTQQDIEEILSTYYVSYKNQNIENASKYLVAGMYIKYFLKAYKEVKKHYFANNKETMYIELQGLEQALDISKKETEQLQSTIEIQQHQIKNLKDKLKKEYDRAENKFIDEILDLKNQNTQLQRELDEWNTQQEELNALRELAFSLKQDYVPTKKTLDISKINTNKIVIVGGHPNWQEQIKTQLPHVRIIDTNALNFDPEQLKEVDLIIFNTATLSHAMYYKMINYARKNKIHIGYIANQNIGMSLSQIEEWYNPKCKKAIN
jgi:hypothetical protein